MATTACVCVGACSSTEERWIEEPGEDASDEGPEPTFDSGRDARPRDARADTKDGGGDDASDALDANADVDADAGDARRDAADASFAETGTPCSPQNAVQTKACGFCGTSMRFCDDPTDAGAPVWQEWGFCGNSVDGGCAPGTFQDVTCGKCGTMNVKCANNCRFPTTGSCKDAGPCYPGETEFTEWLSCETPDLGRTHTCDSTCQWSDYSDCEQRPTGITIPETPGTRAGLRVKLGWQENIGGYANGTSSTVPTTCSWYASTSQYPYAIVELKNPSLSPVVISVWTYPATGAGALPSPNDIAIRVISENPIPDGGIDAGGFDAGAFQKCVPNKATYCCADTTTDPSSCPSFVSGTYCNLPYWGGLMSSEGNGVTVPAESSYYLFVQNLYATGDGDIMIGLKTN